MKLIIKSLAILSTMLVVTSGLNAANRIIVKAEASEEFTKARALDPNKKIQTYQFMEGRYFKGTTKDPGMEAVTFMDIVQNMAVHLQRQNFYPNPIMGEGDLLIVVHYGVTDYEETFEEMLGYTSLEDMGMTDEISSAGSGGSALDFATMDAINNLNFNLNASAAIGSANEQSEYYKAQLLGMEKAYSNRVSPQEEYELKSMLQDERYFVVLMAYDYASVRAGKPMLQWSTRYSIRAVGQSFEDAIADMNLIAGDFFGKNIKDLTKKRVTDKSRVEMGEIEVIGQEIEDEPKQSN